MRGNPGCVAASIGDDEAACDRGGQTTLLPGVGEGRAGLQRERLRFANPRVWVEVRSIVAERTCAPASSQSLNAAFSFACQSADETRRELAGPCIYAWLAALSLHTVRVLLCNHARMARPEWGDAWWGG